jgi:hypothetical protein
VRLQGGAGTFKACLFGRAEWLMTVSNMDAVWRLRRPGRRREEKDEKKKFKKKKKLNKT